MKRAEYDWAEVPYPVTIPGQSDVTQRTPLDGPAGVIWVPDPEQRHFWREVYVDKAGAKPGRHVGFRKPGER